MRLRIILLTAGIAVFAALPLKAQRAIPPHEGRWVHDDAGVLRPETIGQLEDLLKAERDSTSNQIAVLVIKSLEGEDIEGYANRVFKEWKLGDEKKDNGVLFVVAMDDRRMRIEVGYGLEGQLTDLYASRIIRNEVAPAFRRGEMETGIIQGTIAIIRTIQGAYKNEGDGDSQEESPMPGGMIVLMAILLVILFSRRNSGGGGGYWSGGRGYYGGGFGGSAGRWSGGGSGGGFDFGGGGDSGGGGASGSW